MSTEKSLKSGDDLSHLSEDEINEILLPIPSECTLTNENADILKSTPSEEDLKSETGDGCVFASSIRQRLAQAASLPPLAHGELDTRKLTAKLEALTIPQDLLDDALVSDEDDYYLEHLSAPPVTARASGPGGKVKGFFKDISSMWTYPEEIKDEVEDEKTDKDASDDWDFGTVEADVKNFFNKAIEKGTSLIEKGAAELAHTIFKTESDEASAAPELGTTAKPTEDFFEFNDYRIRTKGYGDLTLQSMKLDEEAEGESHLLLKFKVVPNPEHEVKKSVVGNSLFLNYGKDVAEIIVPEDKVPDLLNVKAPLNGTLIVETY